MSDDIKTIAAAAKDSLLPRKSRHLYEQTYNAYRKWCENKNIQITSEDSILAYLNSDLSGYKSSSLWSKYSMLRSTINLREGIDISKLPSVIPFLKRKAEGYTPKKSLTLTKANIDEFLSTADNTEHLFNKVILIFGVSGACRRQELVSLLTTSVEYHQTHFLVKLHDTKTKTDRSFVIVEGNLKTVNLVKLVRNYMDLRSKHTPHNRFFVNYIKNKCTIQPVGINKIGRVPAVVAKYLGLENPSLYTGHCFRRTSATLLANAGANMEGIKRHGGWRSSSVAEGYIDDCVNNKINVAQKILGDVCNAASTSNNSTYMQQVTDINIEQNAGEVGGLHISGNNLCVININYYNK